MKSFKWTGKREVAAILVADDRLTTTEIAIRVGVSERTIRDWNTHPQFAARVQEYVEQLRFAVLQTGIQARARRLDALQDRWQRLLTVIDARAREMANVPGGSSGLLKQRPRIIKLYAAEPDGPLANLGEQLAPQRQVLLTHEYSVDTALLRSLRDLERQAAEELGEWHERPETTEKLIREYVGIDPEDV